MKYIVITLACAGLAFPSFATEEEERTRVAEESNETGDDTEEAVVVEEGEQDVGFGGPTLSGQEGPVPEIDVAPDFSIGVFTVGLWQRDSDTISSKFLEYRDIPNGAVAPYFRFQGKSGEYRYDLIGHDVTQKDQQYFGQFGSNTWRFDLDYTGIPHSFGNGGTSILIRSDKTDGTEWLLSDTLQNSFQTSVENAPSRDYEDLLAVVQPTLDTQPTNIDIKLQRNRTNIGFSLTPGEGNFDVDVTYFHERRTGDRTNNGTSFGFFNVVETTDPIRYVTQDFGVTATGRGDWGLAFAGLHYNDFSDRFDTFIWDNPWRGSDSTDPTAYLGPTLSVNGPKSGRLALPPSNEAITLNGGTTLFFGRGTRLTADLQLGQWRQNEQAFIPYTINTAILTPSGELATEAALPASRLDGKIDVLALNGYFTSKVNDNVRVNARYRFYENENNTPRIRFDEGYVRFDAVWEEIPRITVPFGWNSSYVDVYGTFDAGRILGFELGYKYNNISREFRETENTTENTVRAAADLRFGGGVLLRALYELGSRDFDAYDAIRGEEHSFLCESPQGLIECGLPGTEADPANQTVLRRYDQAKRDRNRAGFQLQWTPESGVVSIGASYFRNKDDYDEAPVDCQIESEFCPGGTSAPLGLQEDTYETFSLDVDVSPSSSQTFYAFYSREDIFNFQTGRQSGGTLVFDPRSNWSSTVDNKVDSIGGGAVFTLVPDEWFLDLFYRYQKVDGNNAFTAGPDLRDPGEAQDIGAYDDTKLNFVSAQLRLKFAEAWTFAVGGFFEDYELDDIQTGSVLNYMPGSFFINANNGDYQAWVGWLNITYSFTL